jgi:hypothetical protein
VKAKVISMHSAVTWTDVREAWQAARAGGWESVRESARVGQMLVELKERTEHGEFMEQAQRACNLRRTAVQNLILLAQNLPLLERHRPDSQGAALRLIPLKKSQLTAVQLVERDQRRIARERKRGSPTEDKLRTGFLVRAWNAREWAHFVGKKADKTMIDEARAASAAWEKVAIQLEELK